MPRERLLFGTDDDGDLMMMRNIGQRRNDAAIIIYAHIKIGAYCNQVAPLGAIHLRLLSLRDVIYAGNGRRSAPLGRRSSCERLFALPFACFAACFSFYFPFSTCVRTPFMEKQPSLFFKKKKTSSDLLPLRYETCIVSSVLFI